MYSFLEYRTAAIYHATRAILSRLDAVQARFLRDIGVDDIIALDKFNLAPLSARRDMAMLGLIHRTVLGKGLEHFKTVFRRDPQHSHRVEDPRRAYKSPLVKRSALGLVAVYNMLPLSLLCQKSVTAFQKGLQGIVRKYAVSGHEQWSEVFSPRLPLASHPLNCISSLPEQV